MIRFRLYLDKDKETAWLNEMAAQGHGLTGFFAGVYRFESCEPGKYVYQVDFGNKLFSVSEDYREFMDEMGVEIVQTWGFWVILRQLASKGEFQMYTDVDSGIEHYSKIRRMFKVVIALELLCLIPQIYGVSRGIKSAAVGLFVLGALVLALMNALFKTNQIIAGLQERKGVEPKTCRGKAVSPVLLAGMLLNSCALLLSDSIPNMIKITIQIAAIALMAVGLFKTGAGNH